MSAPLGSDTEIVLLGAGLMFLLALVCGIWKYQEMATSEDHVAHPYVDTAHRAALLYSFATLLVAVFVELSGWSETVDLVCAGVLYFFFLAAVLGYLFHGWHRDTDNQFRDPGRLPRGSLHPFMAALITGEIVAFSVLLVGFIDARML